MFSTNSISTIEIFQQLFKRNTFPFEIGLKEEYFFLSQKCHNKSSKKCENIYSRIICWSNIEKVLKYRIVFYKILTKNFRWNKILCIHAPFSKLFLWWYGGFLLHSLSDWPRALELPRRIRQIEHILKRILKFIKM